MVGFAEQPDGRWIVLLNGEVRGAIGELADLLTFGNVTSDGVVAGSQARGVDCANVAVALDRNAAATSPGIGRVFLGFSIPAVPVTVTGSPGNAGEGAAVQL